MTQELDVSDETVERVFAAIKGVHLDFYEEPLSMNATTDDIERIATAAIAATRTSSETTRVLVEALEKLADGEEPRSEGKKWRADGSFSKHDRCSHGVWLYETCGNCVSDFARGALSLVREGEK